MPNLTRKENIHAKYIHSNALLRFCRSTRAHSRQPQRGGRAAKVVGIRKPVKLGPRNGTAGERRILPRFWKSSPPNRRKNEIKLLPLGRPFTREWMPEAWDIPPGPCPVGFAFAGLDVHAPASGLILHSRATDEESLRAGPPVKSEVRRPKAQRQRHKSVSRPSHQLSRIPTRDGHGAHKPVPAYASLSFPPDTYDVASRSAF